MSGAWALYPMAVTWSEEFRKIHPGVQIDISAGGAGKGMADCLTGGGGSGDGLAARFIRQRLKRAPGRWR